MMDALKKMLDEYRIPPVIEIKTKFDKTRLPKAEEVLWRAFKRKNSPYGQTCESLLQVEVAVLRIILP
ncbi:hypothetical protein M5E89_13175 [Acidaminococcus intestini]|nr:hypothetical protein M5E89_13175 [Acidaminococcus intestini]